MDSFGGRGGLLRVRSVFRVEARMQISSWVSDSPTHCRQDLVQDAAHAKPKHIA